MGAPAKKGLLIFPKRRIVNTAAPSGGARLYNNVKQGGVFYGEDLCVRGPGEDGKLQERPGGQRDGGLLFPGHLPGGGLRRPAASRRRGHRPRPLRPGAQGQRGAGPPAGPGGARPCLPVYFPGKAHFGHLPGRADAQRGPGRDPGPGHPHRPGPQAGPGAGRPGPPGHRAPGELSLPPVRGGVSGEQLPPPGPGRPGRRPAPGGHVPKGWGTRGGGVAGEEDLRGAVAPGADGFCPAPGGHGGRPAGV